MSPLTSVSASRIEQLPGQIRMTMALNDRYSAWALCGRSGSCENDSGHQASYGGECRLYKIAHLAIFAI
jgi:hypothetical protein